MWRRLWEKLNIIISIDCMYEIIKNKEKIIGDTQSWPLSFTHTHYPTFLWLWSNMTKATYRRKIYWGLTVSEGSNPWPPWQEAWQQADRHDSGAVAVSVYLTGERGEGRREEGERETGNLEMEWASETLNNPPTPPVAHLLQQSYTWSAPSSSTTRDHAIKHMSPCGPSHSSHPHARVH